MKKLLVINASARKVNSHSRNLTELFINHWRGLCPEAVIYRRELGNGDIPHVSEDWIMANFTSSANKTERDREILSVSDAYIDDLRDADVIVLGTPMYNWSIPSTLKAYIDQIMRVNETFRIDTGNAGNPYVGLLRNKTLVMLVARGSQGYEPGQQNEHLNFQTTYLRTVFGMIGIEEIHSIAVSGTSTDKDALKNTIGRANQQIRTLIEGMEL